MATQTVANTDPGDLTPRNDTKVAEKPDDKDIPVFQTYTAPNGDVHTTYVREDGMWFYLDWKKSGVSVQNRIIMALLACSPAAFVRGNVHRQQYRSRRANQNERVNDVTSPAGRDLQLAELCSALNLVDQVDL